MANSLVRYILLPTTFTRILPDLSSVVQTRGMLTNAALITALAGVLGQPDEGSLRRGHYERAAIVHDRQHGLHREELALQVHAQHGVEEFVAAFLDDGALVIANIRKDDV
jgi:hypothetical protein